MFFNIIYVSKALHAMQKDDLTHLLEQSRAWNTEYDITGMLLYIDGKEPGKLPGRFMQVIEGREDDILLLFEKIKKDSRHHFITLLHKGPISTRNFQTWSMGFKTLSKDTDEIPGYIDFDDKVLKNKHRPSFNIALNFLKSFYEINA